MERGAFQDERLVARLRETCVPTWRNVLPGFETACLDEPELAPTRQCLDVAASGSPGVASENIATVFSLADGRVLHVVPGLVDALDLGRELSFALSVRDAVRAAQGNPLLEDLACEELHGARAAAVKGLVPSTLAPLLARVHTTLSKRPLLPLSELERADYTEAELNARTTLADGRSLKRWAATAALPPRPSPVRLAR